MRSETQHLDMGELLALRDGEGNAAAGSHVESCDVCRAELERLNRVREQLRGLPTVSPERDMWPEVAVRYSGQRARRRWIGLGATWLAAAAVAGLLLMRGSGGGVEEPAVIATEPTVAGLAAELAPMIDRSRELESLLTTYAPRRPVLGAGQALAVSVLEERLMLIDEALVESRGGGVDARLVRGLWQERVVALEALVSVQLVQDKENATVDDGWR